MHKAGIIFSVKFDHMASPATGTGTVHVLEHSRIAPPPGSTVHGNSLPLTFFDIPWLNFPLMNLLFFYDFSHPNSYFVHTIIPRLKHSLSLALKHFFPFSGNLVFPTSDAAGMPEIRYKDGDSVSLTFAECSVDFNHLVGNHQRSDHDFHPLVIQILPPATSTNDDPLVVPLLSIRVTLFPNSGLCIGFTHHHVAADASTIFRFTRSWASISKLGGESGIFRPFYDRTLVKDPIGLRSTFWNLFGKVNPRERPQPLVRPNPVLATFALRRAEVEGLKKRVIPRIPDLSYVSSFTVVCGYVWSSMIKARVRIGEDGGRGGDEFEHLAFSADCRRLLDPPLPAGYFGNCITGVIVTVKSVELIQETGFVVAAKLIGEALQERVLRREGILEGAWKWALESRTLNRRRLVAVMGSPRFDVYDMDFGWGRPKKFEIASPRGVDSFSFNACGDNEDDFEVGLHCPKAKMDAFVEVFTGGLNPRSSL